MRPVNAIFALYFIVSVTVTAGPVQARDAAAGETIARVCEPCHGWGGVALHWDVPHLAGQNETYLITQMKAFRRSGAGNTKEHWLLRRHDVVMDRQGEPLSDRDIVDLAAYFSGLPCRLRASVPELTAPELSARCVACHGPEGRSTNPTMPRIAGQHTHYLENQLTSMRDSDVPSQAGQTRRDRHHRIMDRQAAPISDQEIRALARYFASRSCR